MHKTRAIRISSAPKMNPLAFEVVRIYYSYIQKGAAMDVAKLFKSGNSQAVRLPKEFRLPGDRVKIFRRGKQIVLEPMETTWDAFFESLDEFPDDFMKDGRQQPEDQVREPF